MEIALPSSKPPIRGRLPLSRDRILTAAMQIADTEGLDNLSMRQVAKALGVEAMSLYKHVANKDDMLDGLIERVCGEIDLPPADIGWRDGLRIRAHGTRKVCLHHRWAAMLIESRTTPAPSRLRLHDRVLQILRQAGFSPALAFHAILILDSFIYGFTLQEIWWPFSEADIPDIVEDLTPHVGPDDYPHLTEMMGYVMTRADSGACFDSDFAFGLELTLDGLERALISKA